MYASLLVCSVRKSLKVLLLCGFEGVTVWFRMCDCVGLGWVNEGLGDTISTAKRATLLLLLLMGATTTYC